MKTREARKRVVVPARLSAGPRWVDAVILNISSRGLLVKSETPLEVGTYIDIRRGSQVIIGRAVWSDGHQFGVRTQDQIDVEALLSERPRGERPQPGRPADERRADPRRQGGTAAERLERNRALSSMLQFAVIGAVVLVAAGYAALTVKDVLSRPSQAIAAAMAGQ